MKRAVGLIAICALAWGSRLQLGPIVPSVFRADALGATTSAVARGTEVYAKYGCANCHDKNRTGRFLNPNTGTNGQAGEVNFAAEGYTRADLRTKILGSITDESNVRRAARFYRMPRWAGQMSAQEVEDLVEFLWNLRPKGENNR